ncbi:RluA family pseudouridine synthase [bacterium]|nr:RluA family pseudouridine synthase [bacterium]
MENITLIPPNSTHKFTVPESDANKRLDVYLKQLFPSYSRSYFQQLIIKKLVSVNNKIKNIKPKTVTKHNDVIVVTFPPITTQLPKKNIPKDLEVEIIYHDKHFMIINKPSNLVVHPPKITSTEVTLVDWLIHTFHELSSVGFADRPGIVHRLDKDTSGLMIVACNNCSHALLGDLFRNRTIKKTYLAIVKGHPEKEGIINFSIKRNPIKRNSMVAVNPNVKNENGKIRAACTHYKVLEYFENSSLVQVEPVTGRTHQIRVHFSALGHPIIGDHVYGETSKKIKRQALHAYKLSFKFNGNQYDFCQKPPKDFQLLIENLRNH